MEEINKKRCFFLLTSLILFLHYPYSANASIWSAIFLDDTNTNENNNNYIYNNLPIITGGPGIAPSPGQHKPPPNPTPASPAPAPAPPPPPVYPPPPKPLPQPPQPSTVEPVKWKNGLSGGQKAGIVIGTLAGAALLVFIGMVYKKRRANIRRARFGAAARASFL